MSYEDARKCFAENVQLSSPPGHDRTRMMEYNINNGLRLLAEQLRRDVSDLESQIATLRAEVQRLRK